MPITTSARKALRRDIRRTVFKRRIREQVSLAVKQARWRPTSDSLKKAQATLDRAAKKKVLHPNTAARLKSRLIKAARKMGKAATSTAAAKKTVSKKTKSGRAKKKIA
ncbi:MAG: 30S ribosomal protein S20 [Candidatus Chisholmbacteria bacterium]|nr:30S ribosomal protein S20 [Candidatus Chisholmbacteria bacterium]